VSFHPFSHGSGGGCVLRGRNGEAMSRVCNGCEEAAERGQTDTLSARVGAPLDLGLSRRLAGICESGGIQLGDAHEPVATQMATGPKRR
jgi:hypothetical protein